MNAIEITNINVSIHGKHVLKGIDLTIAKGEFMTFLGPSGCGKTTLLRTIAGLQSADEGTLRIGNKEAVNSATGHYLEASKRGVNLVFQSYALWPHMTVYENVAFGLQVQKLPKDQTQARVRVALANMRISELETRYPGQLSGGQQQRVAIARAIVTEPEILLLDEPLSNLDAKLRIEMRAELKRLHHELKTTIIYVTHDQHEAMTLSTQVAVFFGGKVVQVDKPRQLYHRPRTLEVAEFIGNAGLHLNYIEGTIVGSEGGQRLETSLGFLEVDGEVGETGREIILTLKPEDIRLSEMMGPDSLAVHIEAVFPSGSETLVQTRAGELSLMIRVMGDMEVEVGSQLYAKPRMDRINLYDKMTGRLLEVPIQFIQPREELHHENRFSHSR
ncbi:ABC transporter [Paenibacillus pectinilyticus]|uniref:ABC transporter n=1 Tax=Paenibacillus pectinilyticus TaxID=512399 RepID=A0A1C1A6G9_9BACL|nr:ABC transporter ATP-binding protein [Paenibacillus pectinilyticus]OCT16154.1 ABC transporter [Paenibacillus pectinilyticus]